MSDSKLFSIAEISAFVKRCMVSVGASESSASSLADVLIAADTRGHFSHGLNRLGMYISDITQNLCDGKATPVIIKEMPGTAFVDGCNAMGPVVGTFCMDLAIEKAKKMGSNHYGIAGYYSLRAVQQGMIGVSVTNTSSVVVPTRAKRPALGTNPISFAAPGEGDDCFCLDMATSTVALGKVEIQGLKGEPVPPGWGLDKEGRETTVPSDVLKGGGLTPLGGPESTSGYKGYGLAAMIEVMCSILSGGPFCSHVRMWNDPNLTSPANLGHTFIALDPSAFAVGFNERMQQFMDELRQMDPSDPSLPVLVAGDPERQHMKAVKEQGGILYHHNLVQAMNDLAKRLKVEPICSN